MECANLVRTLLIPSKPPQNYQTHLFKVLVDARCYNSAFIRLSNLINFNKTKKCMINGTSAAVVVYMTFQYPQWFSNFLIVKYFYYLVSTYLKILKLFINQTQSKSCAAKKCLELRLKK